MKYPIAFLTPENCLFMRHKKDVSYDGTPRYIPNPNASGTYSIDDCMRDYIPIYTRMEAVRLVVDREIERLECLRQKFIALSGENSFINLKIVEEQKEIVSKIKNIIE